MLEEILDRCNMEKAFTKVISNDDSDSGGIDGMHRRILTNRRFPNGTCRGV
jgi:hypothetical protein